MNKTLAILLLAILAIQILKLPVLAEGEIGTFLEFSLPSTENTILKLSDFRGRIVLLDFFATWCRPCKETIPKLNTLQVIYGNQGLSVIGYAVDKGGRAVIKPHVLYNGIEFPVVIGSMETAKSWGIKVLPTTLLIDPQGRIVERFEGIIEDIRIAIAIGKYLNKDAPEPPTSILASLPKLGEKIIHQFFFYDNEIVAGEKGLVIAVEADFSSQIIEQGTWIQFNLQAQTTTGQTYGEIKPFYLRVDNPLQGQYVLFVRYDQLPPIPEKGRYRSWISIINARQNIIEKSWEQLYYGPIR